MYKTFLKGLIDTLLSFCLLICLLPVFLAVAVFIKCSSRGPVFYKQERVGKNGRRFNIVKFRTMTHRLDRKPGEAGELFITEKNPEMIFGGVMMRRLKIDELPQLVNIVKGDMAIVGPRPCLPETVPLFDEGGCRRFSVQPGCTGLAQINGGIYISWPERAKFDAYYAENLSFTMDLLIILKTIKIVVTGEEKNALKFEDWLLAKRKK